VSVPVVPAVFVIEPTVTLNPFVFRVPVVPDPNVTGPHVFVWLIPTVIVDVYPLLIEKDARTGVATFTVHATFPVPLKMIVSPV